jgi:hypothetical protein
MWQESRLQASTQARWPVSTLDNAEAKHPRAVPSQVLGSGRVRHVRSFPGGRRVP